MSDKDNLIHALEQARLHIDNALSDIEDGDPALQVSYICDMAAVEIAKAMHICVSTSEF